MSLSEPQCPKCGSRNVQKSTAVVEAGTFTTDSSGVGVGLSNGGLSVGAGNAKSSTVSDVAKLNQNNSDAGCAWVAALTIIISNVFLLLFIEIEFLPMVLFSGAAGLVTGTITLIVTRNERAEAQRAYEAQWYCHSCGAKFTR